VQARYFVLSIAGAVAMWDMGPPWFPVARVLIALPSTWAGGALYRRLHAGTARGFG
jgi:hypothetical protein